MAKTISAVVLAAGGTTWMDKPKLTLPLQEKSIVRHVVENVRRAGFRLLEVRHIYLDVVKTITAQAPG